MFPRLDSIDICPLIFSLTNVYLLSEGSDLKFLEELPISLETEELDMPAPIDPPTETLRVQIGLTYREIQIIHRLLDKSLRNDSLATVDLQSLRAKFAPLESPGVLDE